jgi:hypothetical protein
MSDKKTKITDYKVIEVSSLIQLEHYVQDMIRRGYQPLGGVQVTHEEDGEPYSYLQAMVKIKEGE